MKFKAKRNYVDGQVFGCYLPRVAELIDGENTNWVKLNFVCVKPAAKRKKVSFWLNWGKEEKRFARSAELKGLQERFPDDYELIQNWCKENIK